MKINLDLPDSSCDGKLVEGPSFAAIWSEIVGLVVACCSSGSDEFKLSLAFFLQAFVKVTCCYFCDERKRVKRILDCYCNPHLNI